MRKKLPKFQKGQALLIVLLSMAVVLTIVLSILARSITDLSLSSQDEDSLRAFSAAEAGVEKALIIGTDIGSTEIGNATYNASVSSYAEGESSFSNPISLTSGESSTLWFVAHDEDGNLVCSVDKPCFRGSQMKVCWGKSGTSSSSDTTPAIELSIFYTTSAGDYSTARIARAALDPNGSRRASNNFSAPDSGTCTIGSNTFEFQKTISFSDLGIPANVQNLQNGLQFAKIRFFYNTDVSQNFGFDLNFPGNSVLPSQGLSIESSGSSGEANRKLNVFQSYAETPEIFDSVVFSGSGVTK